MERPQCGTRWGYQLHHLNDEDACARCKEACALDARDRRAGDRPLPCPVCKRIHRGQRCRPEEDKVVRVAFTFPPRVAERLRDAVPFRHRSRWVSDLVEAGLDALTGTEQ